MIEMQREVTSTAAPDAAFAYLADFTTTEQWDPGSIRTTRISGDGGVGTRYANTSKFAGRTSDLTYEVTGVTPGRSIQLRWIEPLLRIAVANLLDKGADGLRRELAEL